MKSIAQIFSSRRSRHGFTFIELVVAIALTAILIRAMYTIFTSASTLVRLSEEKTNAIYEAAAVSDYFANDAARTPFFSSNYYLYVPAGGASVVLQAIKQNGLPGYVYVEYYLDSNRIKRRVWNHQTNRTVPDNVATETADGEDGAPVAVAYGVESLNVHFLNDAYRNANGRLNVDETASWFSTGTLTGVSRSRAIKLSFTIASQGDIPAQNYTLIFPLMFN